MGKEYVRIPFDVETAKNIQSGEVDGKISTRDGHPVRITCWDMAGNYPVLALIKEKGDLEVAAPYFNNGMYRKNMDDKDLVLYISKANTFKDGDVLTYHDKDGKPCAIFIYREVGYRHGICYDYACLDINVPEKLTYGTSPMKPYSQCTYATDDEIRRLILELQGDFDDRAIEYLKKFFYKNLKPKYGGSVIAVQDRGTFLVSQIVSIGPGAYKAYYRAKFSNNKITDDFVEASICFGIGCYRIAPYERIEKMVKAMVKKGSSHCKHLLSFYFDIGDFKEPENKPKDGDVLFVKIYGDEYLFVYKEDGGSKTSSYIILSRGKSLSLFESEKVCDDEDITLLRYATEDEKHIFADVIRKKGGEEGEEYLNRFF